MINTAYDPRLLEQWAVDLNSTQEIEQRLEPYLHQYDCAFTSQKQSKHFAIFVRGLLSPLDRKSIEPIALHLAGEKSVRPMQQFFTRAPLREDDILDTYQQLLAAQLNHTGSMLSVDDTSFVKKGTHSIGVKRQYCGRLVNGKTARLECSFPMPGTLDTVWWIMSFISPRNGSRSPIRTCVPDAGSQNSGASLQKTRLPRTFLTMPSKPDGFRHNGSDATLRMDVTMPFWMA